MPGISSSRRAFLTSLVATVGGSLGFRARVHGTAQARSAVRGDRSRIDIHHHVFPPSYVAELASRGLGGGAATNWSVARTLDDMERAGVTTAILSITTPAVSFAEPARAGRLAREANEWVARLVEDHPGRFGSFATLPAPDVDGSMREIEYALDVLKADGVALLTSYGDKWLGHAAFRPVLDELNRRKAVLYTHPTVANCCINLLPDVPPTVIEYGTDTTRTMTDIVFSGAAARCPDLRFIFSHAGGTLPFLTERLVRMPVQNSSLAVRVPGGVLHELRRFYYDTAWAAHPMALASLMKLVPLSQVLFGSDYPYRTGADHVTGLSQFGFSDDELRAISRDNALALLPRLRA